MHCQKSRMALTFPPPCSSVRDALNVAVRNVGLKAALRSDVVAKHVYSTVLQGDVPVTDQRATGRCWAFAGLNLLRRALMQKLSAEERTELSQSYFMYYDKLERCKYVLSCLCDLRNRPVSDRTLHFLLKEPIQDGGQWHMFVNVVKKYGILPKSEYRWTDGTATTPKH